MRLHGDADRCAGRGRAEPARRLGGARHRGAGDNAEGLRGLKALGVRDLNYRMSFLAYGVSSAGWINLIETRY